MTQYHPTLEKSDYEEPCCPLKLNQTVTRIPLRRVLDRLDEYLGQNDYAAAERHLVYWAREADAGHDDLGKLTVLNEQIGLYRKLNRPENGLAAIGAALELAQKCGLGETVTMGTTLVNAATAYKAFGQPTEALPLYERAKLLYEALLEPTDARLGGLYNNMALTLTDMGTYRDAEALYQKAIGIMAQAENGALEMAITYCNMADLAYAELGAEASETTVSAYLDKALDLLDTESLPRNGYYAFVCEKCAPTFGYYGYFLTEQDLEKRAVDIYERS